MTYMQQQYFPNLNLSMAFVLKTTLAQSKQTTNFVKKNQDFSFRNWLLNPVNKINLIKCRMQIQSSKRRRNQNILIIKRTRCYLEIYQTIVWLQIENYPTMKMGQITHCESDTATNGSNNNTTTTIVCDRLPEPTEFANGNPFLMVWFIRYFHQSRIPNLRIFFNIYTLCCIYLRSLACL